MDTSPPQPSQPTQPTLNLATKLAFGAGDWGTALTANLQLFSLLFFFTNVAGLDPAMAGRILLVGKVWDAVNDPLIGFLSDRTRNKRWGRRYPWMLWGSIPFGLSFFLMWIVPTDNQTMLFWYYVIMALIFNTAYTAVNLPYSTLTTEITQDYDDRTSLNSFRFTFSIAGSIFSLLLLGVASQMITDQHQLYGIVGFLCAVVGTLPIYWCVWGTRQRTLGDSQARLQAQDTLPQLPLKQQLTIALSNRPFLLVIGIYLASWLALQITATVIPYFVVFWMGLDTTDWPNVALTVQATAMITLFFWGAISKRIGKIPVYFWGMGLWILAQGGLFFLQPGQTGLMYGMAVLAGCGVSTAYLVPWSLLPDVVDLDELNTGQRREGVFYAFMVFLQKVSLALGIGLVGQALSMAGFINSTTTETIVQPEAALTVIRVAIGPLPTLCLIMGLILAYAYPITREVHSQILLQLAERKQR